MTVRANEWCTGQCAAGTPITLKLINAPNPQLVVGSYSQSVAIKTLNVYSGTDYTIDEVTSGIEPALLETNPLKTATVSRNAVTETGAAVEYTFTIKTFSQIPANGYIRLNVPAGAIYKGTGNPACSVGGNPISAANCVANFDTTDTTLLTSIDVKGQCGAPCPLDSTFDIIVSNVVNPFSVKPISPAGFLMETRNSANYIIDQGTGTPPNIDLTAATIPSATITPTLK